MLRGEGSLETTCIRTEESFKYSIDIGIVLDEMKYGIAWIRSLTMVFKGTTRMYQIVQVSNSLWHCPMTLSIVKSKTIWYSPVAPLKTITFSQYYYSRNQELTEIYARFQKPAQNPNPLGCYIPSNTFTGRMLEHPVFSAQVSSFTRRETSETRNLSRKNRKLLRATILDKINGKPRPPPPLPPNQGWENGAVLPFA